MAGWPGTGRSTLTGWLAEPMLSVERSGGVCRRVRGQMTVTSEGVRQEGRPVDFINVDNLLSDEERGVRDRVREFVDREVIPIAADYWDRAQFPFESISGLGELGLIG